MKLFVGLFSMGKDGRGSGVSSSVPMDSSSSPTAAGGSNGETLFSEELVSGGESGSGE